MATTVLDRMQMALVLLLVARPPACWCDRIRINPYGACDPDAPPLRLIQLFHDGVGSQLTNLFSVIALHGVEGMVFDADVFMETHASSWKISHLDKDEHTEVAAAVRQVVRRFENGLGGLPHLGMANSIVPVSDLASGVHSHARASGDRCPPANVTMALVSAWSSMESLLDVRVPERRRKALHNMEAFANAARGLIPERRLPADAIVAHVRLGDALEENRWDERTTRPKMLARAARELPHVLRRIQQTHPGSPVYVHSDGDPARYFDHTSMAGDGDTANYTLLPRNSSVLQIIADFAHARVFVSGVSGLSEAGIIAGRQAKVWLPQGFWRPATLLPGGAQAHWFCEAQAEQSSSESCQRARASLAGLSSSPGIKRQPHHRHHDVARVAQAWLDWAMIGLRARGP